MNSKVISHVPKIYVRMVSIIVINILMLTSGKARPYACYVCSLCVTSTIA